MTTGENVSHVGRNVHAFTPLVIAHPCMVLRAVNKLANEPADGRKTKLSLNL